MAGVRSNDLLLFGVTELEIILEKTTVWDEVLDSLRSTLNEQVFNTWFLAVKFVRQDDAGRQLFLRAGSVTRDWICRYYKADIEEIMARSGCGDYELVWETDDESGESAADGIADELFFEPVAQTLPLVGRSVILSSEPEDAALNPKYTFDKFVVGSGNQFAHAAALGAAESPGTTYNPLFLYGGVGLGKTHLMHAIGHSIKQHFPHMRVAYITSEKFMNELINAIRYDRTPAFRDKYRSIDVLLMDDIQFMAGKERTQEEFFHTFNTLHNLQKQIVLSCDCPPREIPTLEERLHSRFEWGLIADIEPPDLETKVAILKRKADLDGIFLPDDIAIYIAGKIKSNVRELEGSLVRLVAISSLKQQPLSRSLAQEAMKNFVDSDRGAGVTMERIIRIVSEHYGMTVDEIKSKSNARSISQPRQVAMYLCKRMTRHSFPEIGKEFGGKHHTTVMHSVEKIAGIIETDRVFHNVVEELIDNISN